VIDTSLTKVAVASLVSIKTNQGTTAMFGRSDSFKPIDITPDAPVARRASMTPYALFRCFIFVTCPLK
jgi:hypothetical protein